VDRHQTPEDWPQGVFSGVPMSFLAGFYVTGGPWNAYKSMETGTFCLHPGKYIRARHNLLRIAVFRRAGSVASEEGGYHGNGKNGMAVHRGPGGLGFGRWSGGRTASRRQSGTFFARGFKGGRRAGIPPKPPAGNATSQCPTGNAKHPLGAVSQRKPQGQRQCSSCGRVAGDGQSSLQPAQ